MVCSSAGSSVFETMSEGSISLTCSSLIGSPLTIYSGACVFCARDGADNNSSNDTAANLKVAGNTPRMPHKTDILRNMYIKV